MRSNSFRAIMAGLVSAVVMMTACDKYDDSALVARMDKAENDIKELRTLVEKLNTDLSSLATVVDGLKKQDKIVSVSELPDKSGYKVVFSESGEFTIYNGKNGLDGKDGKDGTNGTNGEDGKTPTIGVKLDADGNYYWTVNGEYLLDDQGNKIAATAHVATPQLRINEGNFEISYNGGVTWEVIGSAGNAGNVVFSKVEDGETSVKFTLADGTEIIIPKVQQFAISISTDVVIGAGESKSVPYTITASDEATVVDAFGTKGFEAEVTMTNASSGNLQITAPDPLTTGKVYIIAVKGDGTTAARILSCEEGVFTLSESAFVAKVPASGGTFEVPFQTNLDDPMVMVAPGYDWISYVETKTVRNGTIVFNISENTSEEERTGQVSINFKNYTIVQEGKSSTPASGGKADIETLNSGTVTTSVGNYSTTGGWTLTNGFVHPTISESIYAWTTENQVCATLSGGTRKIGNFASPDITGGIGTLKITYGSRSTAKTISYKIEIKDKTGNVIKEDTVTQTDVVQYSTFNYSHDFNQSGDVKIVITNLCPSNSRTVTVDIVSIISLEWTGYSE